MELDKLEQQVIQAELEELVLEELVVMVLQAELVEQVKLALQAVLVVLVA